MMTQANAPTDPVAAARAIAETARDKANRKEDTHGMVAVIAMIIGVLVSLTAIGAMALSPATLPSWCATHACPTAPTFPHTI
jgi:hypothetical protein